MNTKILTVFLLTGRTWDGPQRKDVIISYIVISVNVKLIRMKSILPVGHRGSTNRTGTVPENLGQQP